MWRMLYPGMRLKRYLAIVAVGFISVGAAIGNSPLLVAYARRHPSHSLDGALVIVGLALVGLGTAGLWRSLTEVLGSERWAGLLYSRRHLARGPKVVALGGGTGLPSVLRGLKQYTSNLTAIVTVADDGGSSGRLRGELGMLPPGDIRNCLVALADTEPLMEKLFQLRFQSGELAGHSFGNLFLAAMEQAAGDFVTALRESSRVLAVRGTVLPATLDHVTLKARLDDGTEIQGESAIGRSPRPIERVWMDPPDATPLAEAIFAIESADVVVLGPGSLYTSLMPNLLVEPIAEAIRRSRALRIFVANVMTQPGETAHFTVQDHLAAIERQVGRGIIDVVLVNSERVPPELAERYLREGAEPVRVGVSEALLGPLIIRDHLLSKEGLVRHDPDKLARAILRTLLRFRPKWAEGRMMDALWLESRLREKRQNKWDGRILGRSKPN